MKDRAFKAFNKSYFYVTVFFLIILFVLLYAGGFYPLGDKSILTSDMRSQYVDFFAFFKNELLSSYSFNLGMGADVLTFFAYYLCSPINLVLFFFDNMAHGALAVFVIKLYLCAVFCSLYFNKSQISPCTNPLRNALFSVIYAFCGFNVVYSMSILWLDSVYLFPLLALSLEKAVLERKRYLTFVVAAVVLVNYYTGIMSVYFSLIYFAAVCISKRDKAKETFLFVLENYFTGVSLTAILLIPSFIGLAKSKMNSDNNLAVVLEKFGVSVIDFFLLIAYIWIAAVALFIIVKLISFFRKKRDAAALVKISSVVMTAFIVCFIAVNILFLAAGISFSRLTELRYALPFSFEENAPQLYSGSLSLIGIVCLIAVALKSKSRDAAALIVLVLLSLVPLMSEVLDTLLHFGQPPVSFPFRYTFAVSFFLILSGAYGINHLLKKDLKMIVNILVCAVFISETALNAVGAFAYNEKHWFGYDKDGAFQLYNDQMKAAMTLIDDDGFYRTEKDFLRNLNDQMQFGYNGLTHYSSMYNRNLIDFLARCGFITTMHYNTYIGQTPLTDLLFGVRYLFDSDDEYFISQACKDISLNKSYYADIYDKAGSSGYIDLYKNENFVDFAFWADDDILSLKGEMLEKNSFENLNTVFSAAMGEDITPYLEQAVTDLDVNCYEITASEDGLLFISLSQGCPEYNSVYVNGSYMSDGTIEMFGITNRNIYCGTFEKGDTVKIALDSPERIEPEKVRAYIESQNAYDEIASGLKNSGVLYNFTSQSNISATTDRGGVLVTETPYDENWVVTCDGKAIDTENILNVFLGIKLPEGSHVVSLVYENKGLKQSVIITGLSLVICGINFLLRKRRLRI